MQWRCTFLMWQLARLANICFEILSWKLRFPSCSAKDAREVKLYDCPVDECMCAYACICMCVWVCLCTCVKIWVCLHLCLHERLCTCVLCVCLFKKKYTIGTHSCQDVFWTSHLVLLSLNLPVSVGITLCSHKTSSKISSLMFLHGVSLLLTAGPNQFDQPIPLRKWHHLWHTHIS